MAKPKIKLEEMQFDGWDQLESLAVFGELESCAKKLGISADTLDRRLNEKYGFGFAVYREKIARQGLRFNLARKQYEVAMSGHAEMLKWLGKCYLGQSERVEHKGKAVEVTGKDGATLETYEAFMANLKAMEYSE